MKTSCGMKLAAMVAVYALAPIVAIADSNVIGFWDFKGGTVGEEVGTVYDTSGQWEGTASKARTNSGTMPTYTNAYPGFAIFADESRQEVLVSDPMSLHFSIANGSGGYIDIDGLSTELTTHTAFTVEFFVRLDDASNNPWTEPVCFRTQDRYASVTVGNGATKTIKFNNYNIENVSVGGISSGSVYVDDFF